MRQPQSFRFRETSIIKILTSAPGTLGVLKHFDFNTKSTKLRLRRIGFFVEKGFLDETS
jgi:hypothetical protein